MSCGQRKIVAAGVTASASISSAGRPQPGPVGHAPERNRAELLGGDLLNEPDRRREHEREGDAFSQENPDFLSCHGQINCTACTSTNAGPVFGRPTDLRQVGYNVPRYAVSRPPIVTADHSSAVAATTLTPRDEAAPAVSQAAASRLTVFCRSRSPRC